MAFNPKNRPHQRLVYFSPPVDRRIKQLAKANKISFRRALEIIALSYLRRLRTKKDGEQYSGLEVSKQ